MFSIKQFIINLSSEARQELRNLIDEIEASISAETPVVEKFSVTEKNEALAPKAEAPTKE
jgi:hypothetical protein